MQIKPLSYALHRIGPEFIQKTNLSPRTVNLIEKLKNSGKKISSNFTQDLNFLNSESKIVSGFLKSHQKESVLGRPIGKLNIAALSKGKIASNEQLGKDNFKIIRDIYTKFGPIGKNKDVREGAGFYDTLVPSSPTGSIKEKYEKRILENDKVAWIKKEMSPAELEASMAHRQPRGEFNIWDNASRTPILTANFNKNSLTERINTYGQGSLYRQLELEVKAKADLVSREGSTLKKG